MSSWAARLGKTAEVPTASEQKQEEAQPVAILDANAIISLGAAAASLAPVLASTEEVVGEIKDASARAALNLLSISLRAPTEAAVRAVATFAARTGDLHQLSTEDVRLIALAYTNEEELYGIDHLRTEPVPVRAQGGKTARQKLPGWGCTDATWEEIDKIADDGVIAATPATSTGWASTCATPCSKQTDADDSWEVARSSKNAERRAKRKAMRRKNAAQELQPPAVEAAAVLDSEADIEHFKGVGTEEQLVAQLDSKDEEECAGAEPVAEPNSREEASAAEASDTEATEEANENTASETADSEHSNDEQASEPAHQSIVSLVTSDFAMQNVAIQMGLRLVSKGGKEITSLQRSVLRCDGCATICKNQSKVFCPACGHATLSKVLVTVGTDGTEHIGVRKRFTLRGTRYSLPKPKGGARSANAILSEDVYKARVRVPRKPAATGELDLEDIRFGELKKHANQSKNTIKGLYHLSTGARNNPNERNNMTRSNRRR